MDERGGRIALVAEQVDPEDSFRLTGLFDAHWEALEGQDHGDGPKGVSVDEAIAWARHHARYVSVRVGSDTHYSAGELDLAELDDNDPDPRWPAGGMIVRARPVGTPPDGSVQEVDWLIEANATGVPAGGPEEFARLSCGWDKLRCAHALHRARGWIGAGRARDRPHLRGRLSQRLSGTARRRSPECVYVVPGPETARGRLEVLLNQTQSRGGYGLRRAQESVHLHVRQPGWRVVEDFDVMRKIHLPDVDRLMVAAAESDEPLRLLTVSREEDKGALGRIAARYTGDGAHPPPIQTVAGDRLSVDRRRDVEGDRAHPPILRRSSSP
jgi:hypothetical protein